MALEQEPLSQSITMRPTAETNVLRISSNNNKVMERRDKTALHPIISRCVRPGAEVHSDDWASYRQMDRKVNNVSAQQVVVHRLNFVNPVTGVHTQEIESYWNS
ncbi:hypothetical protein pdam_00011557 [Pocillopora damicornis]|uniref:ISXO2-like transposase domain-containing protein n=1 Tax=Pocillopora damicornis TaxID=46731 RepID=A0A3M6THW8_POCDA|nr:hypothetical protein pdam_00011557 [Pocillopora damicornis]